MAARVPDRNFSSFQQIFSAKLQQGPFSLTKMLSRNTVGHWEDALNIDLFRENAWT